MKKVNATLKLSLDSMDYITVLTKGDREYAVSVPGSLVDEAGHVVFHKVWVNPRLWDNIVTGNEIHAGDLVEVTGEISIPEAGEDHHNRRERTFEGVTYQWDEGTVYVNTADAFTKWEAKAKSGVFSMPLLKPAKELRRLDTGKKDGRAPATSKAAKDASELE